jgi:hypothetical protein
VVASGGIVLACACFVASEVAWFSISKGKMPCPLLGYRGIPISGAGCVGFHIQFLGWAAKVHIFSNEAPEVCPDLEKGGYKRKKGGRPSFLGEVLYCVWQASIYNGKYVPEDLPYLL